MNDIKDKQYLALELTKILYGDNNTANDNQVYNSYKYFLEELTNTIDDILTTDSLKKEIERLRKENASLKSNNRECLQPLINDIVTLIDGYKGDMEPYVYEAILSNCKRYEN